MSSWWSLPRARELAGVVYTGGVTSAGDIIAASSDGVSFTLGTWEDDDHNTPAVLVESGKPPIVFYTRHNVDSVMRYRKGTVGGGLASLGSEQTITLNDIATYVQAYRVPGTDRIVFFYRENNRKWRYKISDDYGDTWATAKTLLDWGASEQMYMGSAQNGNTLRVVAYGHPSESTKHQIRFCSINLSTGDITKVDGTVLSNLYSTTPNLADTDLDLVYDPDPDGLSLRLFDVSQATLPEVCFGTWTSDTNTNYRYARWTGSAWVVKTVAAAGALFGETSTRHYVGGMSFPNPTAGSVLYLARESSGVWLVEKKTTADGGDTWTTTEVTRSSMPKLVRPYAPVDADVYDLLWDTVESYTLYDNYTRVAIRVGT